MNTASHYQIESAELIHFIQHSLQGCVDKSVNRRMDQIIHWSEVLREAYRLKDAQAIDEVSRIISFI